MASSRYIRPSVLVIVALALVVFAAPQARAILGDHFVNGYQLLQRCLNGDRKIETQLANQMAQALIDKGACYAYIEGFSMAPPTISRARSASPSGKSKPSS
jgi:hypothetical protein